MQDQTLILPDSGTYMHHLAGLINRDLRTKHESCQVRFIPLMKRRGRSHHPLVNHLQAQQPSPPGRRRQTDFDLMISKFKNIRGSDLFALYGHSCHIAKEIPAPNNQSSSRDYRPAPSSEMTCSMTGRRKVAAYRLRPLTGKGFWAGTLPSMKITDP